MALYETSPSLEAPFILRSMLTPNAAGLAGEMLRALAHSLDEAGPGLQPAGRYGLFTREEPVLQGRSRTVH